MRPQAGSTADGSGVTPDSQRNVFRPAVDENGNSRRTRSGNLNRTFNAKEQLLSTKLLDAQDTLDIIAAAGSKEDGASEASLSLEGTQSAATHQRTIVRPAPTSIASTWSQFLLVKRKIIRVDEVNEYLDFYFAHLWHLFPVSLVAEEPVLAMSLIMTAARHHPLSGFNGEARSEIVHWRTWPWVQRVLQSSIWGSSVMRKPGSVAALLLFIEWHPRAINSPEDIVGDCSEIDIFEPQAQTSEGAPAYRSNKMSWMLLSTAIDLGKELGCFDDKNVLPHPRAGGAPLENDPDRLEWSRILCTFLCLTDEALALRLRLDPQLANTNWTEMVYRLPSTLTADGFSENAVDLAIHMRKARELLLAWRKSEHGAGPPVSAAAWDSFKRGLDRWETQRHFSRSDLSLRGACLDIEYYYVRLCGLSPAAHMFERSMERHEHTDPCAMSLLQFAEAATKAAIDMLELLTQYLAPSLPFKRVAVRQNAPDDIHMSQRYADLLEVLINAALRPSSLTGNTTSGGSQTEVNGRQPSLDRVESSGVENCSLDLGWISMTRAFGTICRI
ncbi:hypothetical protein P170DRAFT_445109 [Aspergillus steynii IBT 23096]|uniref:Transcription factor domain-containing protein n=1 Tax=Aspergillus steynii IBT 23096 TaxID=1392250 RepID=A0A2I2GKD0_9EURO|nr:uncharacterized protein P170DRAFT_445109 [Aspergillus steynii IBT 23096]PLB53334.1 hypothetical protein P170DRAFT_445109 [Aspergillus steynii IBT 23096]